MFSNAGGCTLQCLVKKHRSKTLYPPSLVCLKRNCQACFGFPCSRLHLVLSREVTQLRWLRLPIVYVTESLGWSYSALIVNSHCRGNGRGKEAAEEVSSGRGLVVRSQSFDFSSITYNTGYLQTSEGKRKIKKDGGRGLAGLWLVYLLRLDCTERRLPALRRGRPAKPLLPPGPQRYLGRYQPRQYQSN